MESQPGLHIADASYWLDQFTSKLVSLSLSSSLASPSSPIFHAPQWDLGIVVLLPVINSKLFGVSTALRGLLTPPAIHIDKPDGGSERNVMVFVANGLGFE